LGAKRLRPRREKGGSGDGDQKGFKRAVPAESQKKKERDD